MNEAVTRPAVPADAAAIGRIHVRAWRAAYRGLVPDALLANLSEEQAVSRWSERLRRAAENDRRILVAVVDGATAGFAVVGASRDDDATDSTGELLAIYLVPEVWDRGVGHALHDVAIDELRALGMTSASLWVLTTNDRARRFYERHGWALDGSEKEAVKDGVALPASRYRCGL